jgi:hypothetical protein
MLLGAGEKAEFGSASSGHQRRAEYSASPTAPMNAAASSLKSFCGMPIRFDDYLSQMVNVDILICSTERRPTCF